MARSGRHNNIVREQLPGHLNSTFNPFMIGNKIIANLY